MNWSLSSFFPGVCLGMGWLPDCHEENPSLFLSLSPFLLSCFPLSVPLHNSWTQSWLEGLRPALVSVVTS
jgi:hypothetical protein